MLINKTIKIYGLIKDVTKKTANEIKILVFFSIALVEKVTLHK